MDFRLELTGTKKLVHRNVRLANPLDEYTKKLSVLTSKRKKTEEDLIAILKVESRGSLYETDDGLVGLATGAVWSCIYAAAKAYKLGEDIKRALSFDDVTVPLSIGGKTYTCDQWVSDPVNIDYRAVNVNGRKVMRARPFFRDWSAVVDFSLLTDVIDKADLIPVIERAGRLVGLGERHPIWGTFTANVM